MSSYFGLLQYGLLLVFIVYVYKIYSKALTKKRRAALRKKVVVITGASSGIGEALAHEFYEQGCKVVLAARRVHELNRVKEELKSKKLPSECPEPVALQLDLGNLEECEQFVKKVHETCGHVDILVNNGGLAHSGSNLKTKFEIHKHVMYVNYFGTVVLTNGFLPKMRERKSGQVVIVSSVLGRMAVPYRAPYCASKHALIAYGDALRAEVHKFNIQVSVIIPGYVQTEISARAIQGATGKEIGILEDGVENGYTAAYAASKFVDMIADRVEEGVLCQPLLSCAMLLRRLLPSLYFYLMTKRTI